MRIIAKRTLKQFWESEPRAEIPLRAWFAVVEKADWSNGHDVRQDFGSADFVGNNRVIFDIGGNKFRLVVRVSYEFKVVYVRFIGTHKEYDRIKPESV